MYSKAMISLAEAQAAVTAMIAEFNKDPDRPKIDMAVVDDAGNLLAYARLDGCLEPTFAVRKAYTCAKRGMNSGALGEMLSSAGMSLDVFSDPQYITFGGGVVVKKNGAVVGGIGVGGLPTGEADEEISLAGMAAMNL
jgi:cob(I)alamin adenosyltransferase